MYRDSEDEFDEDDDAPLEDTREYRVGEGPEDDFEDEYEGEYEEGEYEDDEYEEGEYEEDAYEDDDLPDKAEQPKRPGEPRFSRLKGMWAAVLVQARGVDLPSWLSRRTKDGPKDDAAVEQTQELSDGPPEFTQADPSKPEATQAAAAELERKTLLGGLAILLACLVVGFGSYAIGKSSGDEVDAARIQGEAAGQQAGAIKGAAEGYAAGFQKGRDQAFLKAYRKAYRIYYKQAFEQAGLDVPRDKEIEVPEP